MNAFYLLVIFAAIAAGLGGLLWWWRLLAIREVALMDATPLSSAAAIAALAPGTAVEAAGTLECAAPLQAEFSLKPCVYFNCQITREERDYRTDSNGDRNATTRTVTVHSNERHAPCLLRDASGAATLDLAGAQVEAVLELDRLGPPDTIKGSGFFAALATAGNRYVERLLVPGTPVFVLGEVLAGGGIGAPAKGSANRTFVVTYKSKAERSRDMASRIKWSFVGVVVCAVLTIVLLGLALKARL